MSTVDADKLRQPAKPAGAELESTHTGLPEDPPSEVTAVPSGTASAVAAGPSEFVAALPTGRAEVSVPGTPLAVPLEARLEHELRKSRAIAEIARALSSTLDVDELLNLIMERVTVLMDADRSTLYLLDEQAGELWSTITQGNAVREIRLELGEGVAGWVAKTGQLLNIADVYEDERFNRGVDLKSGYRTRSVLCVPLLNNRGRILGVVQVLNKSTAAVFDPDDEQLLAALAGHAAVALENAQLLRTLMAKNRELLLITRRLERKMAELDLLFEIEAELARAREVEAVLEGMINRAADRLGAEAGAALLLHGGSTDGSGELFILSANEGEDDRTTRRVRSSTAEGVLGWVAREGQPALVNDVSNDPRNSAEQTERMGISPRNLAAVPLRAEGRILGAVTLVNKLGDRPFSDDDLQVLMLIGAQTAKAISLVQAHEREMREERLSTIGQMLSSLLHDLRTPMTVASGYAQMMVETDAQAERGEFAGLILRQFEIMNSMAREVLGFARGERNLLVRKVMLHQFLAEMRTQVEQDFLGRNVVLDIEDGYRGVAYFDELKLRRVFANIARNAAEAMAPTGGRFSIACHKMGDELLIGFADTGKGIPSELEGKLFQTFASHGKAGGTGLGLAMVKKIVEDHGGVINYVSRPGQGTTFLIALPQAQSRATPGFGVPARPSIP
jgi:signal transduction histidine kinase